MTVTIHWWAVVTFVVAVPVVLQVLYLACLWCLSQEGRR